MTIFEMLEQSGILTVLGMAVVFIFLWIMIVCISFAGKIIQFAAGKKDSNTVDSASSDHIAAISAAVSEHKKTGA